MIPEFEALRSHRAVIVSVISAAISISILCLVGIAVMLGWIGGKPVAAPPASASPASRPSSAVLPGVALIPGETLVTPAEAPATPAVAPATTPPAAAPASAPQRPSGRAEGDPRPRPATPAYARPGETQANRPPRKTPRAEPAPAPGPVEARPAESGDPFPRRLVCRTCGTVTGTTTYPDFWEVRVRLEDGASFSVRYHSPPTLRLGDRVRLANGRLERE